MYLVYEPEGASEPRRWRYKPNRLMSAEREMLERRTGRNFAAFTTDVLEGNALCRRALLYMFLKREHATVRWEDVDFTWDELTLEYSRQEFQAMREAIAASGSGPEQAAQLEAIDREMAGALDEEDEVGKAQLPIVG